MITKTFYIDSLSGDFIQISESNTGLFYIDNVTTSDNLIFDSIPKEYKQVSKQEFYKKAYGVTLD